MQWLDDIPTDEVFALSNAYVEDVTASTSQDNTDSGANDTRETEMYDCDSIFEVKGSHIKAIAEGLRLSISSLSTVSSLQLGEEAGSSNIEDEPPDNTLQVHATDWSKSKSPRKSTLKTDLTSGSNLKEPTNNRNIKTSFHYVTRPQATQMPTKSKVVATMSPIVNPQKIVETCSSRRKRKTSVTSVAILAKYKLKQDRKSAFTITLLIALFILFKVPYAFALLGNAFRGEYWVTVQVYEAVTWLYWIKSVTNPFVYAFISKRFRVYCKKLFSKARNLFNHRPYHFH